jgi:hypothetical protein
MEIWFEFESLNLQISFLDWIKPGQWLDLEGQRA